MLALHDDTKIHSTFQSGGWFSLPTGDRVSPALDGWSGPDGLMVSAVQDADPLPDGSFAAGSEIKLVEGRPKYVINPMSVAQAEAHVRSQRDALLASSDWTQVADAPVDQAAWAAYRQALRDVPQQAGFPFNVTWPQEP